MRTLSRKFIAQSFLPVTALGCTLIAGCVSGPEYQVDDTTSAPVRQAAPLPQPRTETRPVVSTPRPIVETPDQSTSPSQQEVTQVEVNTEESNAPTTPADDGESYQPRSDDEKPADADSESPSTSPNDGENAPAYDRTSEGSDTDSDSRSDDRYERSDDRNEQSDNRNERSDDRGGNNSREESEPDAVQG